MQNNEHFKKKDIDLSDVKLEKFKKAAFEVIEYKDKIIRMLCAILEVQGTTTLNIKEFISNATDVTNDNLFMNNEYELKANKKKTSSRKRTLINIPDFRTIKKNKELNLFSTPNKINEELNKENHFSDSILSSYKLSLKEKNYENKIIDNNLKCNFSEKKNLQEQIVNSSQKKNENSWNTLQKKNDGFVKNILESHRKALENFRNNEANFECTYKSDSQMDIKTSKNTPKIKETINEECQLCLMPNTESLHGNFPPIFYKLNCDHVFHLMCLYEIIIRRECRKTCCICHNELDEEDKDNIIRRVKREKKENDKKSKLLFKVMKLQSNNKNQK
ncbi:conserved Plasmodium protein, unknown function [Plasmodium gallinaceum]|uniref:RING-type domain-containing protein n=1 Tax=Plasmodium gallinaceum TaxID=5849 RepID=A0A1J1GS73_PLAGA|nr:conserved Plasmodium protein, unknown function [Plasmodium gallinaceum]CRG95156.1 conserved Plasmodium protein, unknown function [Plasmodium gallinaceum]